MHTIGNFAAIATGTAIGVVAGKTVQEKLFGGKASNWSLITSVALNAFSHYYAFAAMIAAPVTLKSISIFLAVSFASQTITTLSVLAIVALANKCLNYYRSSGA